MNCKHCGGRVIHDKKNGVLHCPFCDSEEPMTASTEKEKSSEPLRPAFSKNGRLMKAVVILACICAVISLIRFTGAARSDDLQRWMAALCPMIQAVLFSLTYLFGRQIIRDTDNLFFYTGITGFFLFIPTVLLS